MVSLILWITIMSLGIFVEYFALIVITVWLANSVITESQRKSRSTSEIRQPEEPSESD